MGYKFAEIAFTPTIRVLQEQDGSREIYARMEQSEEERRYQLTAREAEFIAQRDSFYMATVSETGWPMIQHRGGATGFLKVLGEQHIGFADYAGNRQFISIGNLQNNDRVALFLMSYPEKRRLKILGRVTLLTPDDTRWMPELCRDIGDKLVQRGLLIQVEAFDWNCPQHITPRFSDAELNQRIQVLEQENRTLRAQLRTQGQEPV